MMDFGKNRVQYNEPRDWKFYRFDKYDVYFYAGGKELATYTARQAKGYITEMERLFDFSLDDKIDFLVFNKQSDFKQSNLGLITDESYNIGGVTRIAGSKVSLYFEGDHGKLDLQIRSGIAEVLINQYMYGGNIKQMLKNSTLLNLPEWYTSGLVSWTASRWNVDVDNRVKDAVLSNAYKRFNQLTGMDATYAGHAIWNYVAETYGESVLSNVLYMTKVTRNIESSFLFVLGVSLENLYNEAVRYYQDKYTAEKDRTVPGSPVSFLKKRFARRPMVYTQFKLSPDNNYGVFVTNEMGQYRIWLRDLQKNKTRKIYKREPRLDRVNDYSFPLIAWHPTGEVFAFVTEQKGEILLSFFDIKEKKVRTIKIFNFEKILDLSYSSDGKKLVMSAVQNGQSDIFVYNIAGGSAEQITHDAYDDLHPRFINNSTKIIFSSNRLNDTIRFSEDKGKAKFSVNKDLFVYNYSSKSNMLRRVTETPSVNEDLPSEYDSLHVSYIGDNNGIRNRYIASFDSVIAFVDTTEHYRQITRTFPVTNYPRNILEQDVNPKAGKISEIIFSNGKYRLYVQDMNPPTGMVPPDLKNTSFRSTIEKNLAVATAQKQKADSVQNVVQKVKVIVTEPEENKDTTGIDINNYIFEGDQVKKAGQKENKKEPAPEVKTLADNPQANATDSLVFPSLRNYNTWFSTDYIVTQLDNSFLNTAYQKYTGPSNGIYLDPGFTGFFKVGMSDLFDDLRIVGAVRLSGDLNSNEYYLSWENRLKRLDRQIVVHRQGLFDITGVGSSLVKIHTHNFKYILKYPFSEVASFRTTFGGRYDRTAYLSTDITNLQQPNLHEYWASGKVEFVYDNTIKKGLNLYNGTRLKVFGEYYKQLNDFWDTLNRKHDLFVVGFDVRNYKKIHRDIIWANRIAASTSFGKQKLVYFMGGVDNWFIPKFDNNTPICTDCNYAYQTLATNMRGFRQNIRNGNSFVVINSEIRVPIFRYLLNRPIRSDFIHNFQVIVFGDIGTAWNGPDPYSNENSLNKQIINQYPLTLILYTRHEPIVGGYGFGIRSRVFGYFVRLDWSWGVEDLKVQPRIKYLSFSLDF